MSWLHHDNGYHLLCNRDEKRVRQAATPPRIEAFGGVSVVAPRDGDFGGTWIAANEFGVSICLLNGASLGGELPGGRNGAKATAPRSRGELVLALSNARTARQVCERAWQADFTLFAPFTIAALAPDEPAALVEWNGIEKAILLEGDSLMPLASSSFDAPGARTRRHQEFQRVTANGERLTTERLYAFHESHGCGPGAYSPCMHRGDAETVSFSWITVTPESVGFFYAPGAPCQFHRGETTRLERAQ